MLRRDSIVRSGRHFSLRRGHARVPVTDEVGAEQSAHAIAAIFSREYDVVVVGGGNAALCAALSARSYTKNVMLLERAPESMRGGNSRHTRDIRHAHHRPDKYVQGQYSEEEFLDDLSNVSEEHSNSRLAELMVRESHSIPEWMEEQGVRWQDPLRGTLHLGRTNRFFLGGGKALVNTYYRRLASLGTDVMYGASVEDLIVQGGRCEGVSVHTGARIETIRARAVVVACGGFEANLEWLRLYWGDGADNYIIRGPKYNDGTGLSTLMRHGAATVGNPKAFHSVAVDARSPKYDGGIATRLDSLPWGIVVNRCGERFYDEGEDLWPKRYAIWGRLIAEQEGQTAYSIFDSKMTNRFMPSIWPALQADSIEALAGQIEVDPRNLLRTVSTFNEAIPGGGSFDPSTLDNCETESLVPPKSHWAVKIDSPPYFAYPLKPGITFTYMGVAVDESARVRMDSGQYFDNIYAAGEIMAGNVLTRGYLAGTGLTIGTVFGRIAGREAARHATA
jgi:tricarballylate dehydrogenase